MKNFNTLLNELNKYEKETAKKARAFFIKDLGHKKYKELGLNQKSSLKPFQRAAEDQRSNPKNPYVSPRRESENVIGAFQDTEPGQKGRGNRVDPETGKVTRYNPTQARQKEMRGVSKKKSADIQKIVRKTGDKQLDMVYKNIGGSQNRRIYQKAFSGTELEKVAGDLDMFPKTRTTGAPTTVNIPKGKIPEPPKIKPISTFKPPKGSVGAMKSPVKPKTFQKVLKVLSKNKKTALIGAGIGAGIGAINALKNRRSK
tara:strand:- start:88 stop:858 length:771 start_codon:yes stop_codon:yes gene_type:complete